MKKILGFLKYKNIETGFLYFYIHFVTEVACFYFLSNLVGDSVYLWLCPLIYDALAFVPQSIIGYLSDKIPKINFGMIGLFLLIISIILFNLNIDLKFLPLVILCIGNACIHINGAEVTLKTSDGKLSHSAIFVAGGSFGVITGKLLASIKLHYIFIILLLLSVMPFILYAEQLLKDKIKEGNADCSKFNYESSKINKYLIVLLAIFVVIVRGYMGYGIPTSWNKTVIQTIFLYVFMGLGKAFGGIVSDTFGIKKTAILSAILAVPFLLFGDNIMVISLIGVMLFSMTMSITLAILVSVLNRTPGLAFGLTTIGLFIGTIPIFIFKFTTVLSNSIIILILSFICILILNLIIKGDKDV